MNWQKSAWKSLIWTDRNVPEIFWFILTGAYSSLHRIYRKILIFYTIHTSTCNEFKWENISFYHERHSSFRNYLPINNLWIMIISKKNDVRIQNFFAICSFSFYHRSSHVLNILDQGSRLLLKVVGAKFWQKDFLSDDLWQFSRQYFTGSTCMSQHHPRFIFIRKQKQIEYIDFKSIFKIHC